MGGRLKCVYADEFWVVAADNVSDGSCLDLRWPFKIPPECGKDAIATCSMQTEVAACNANGRLEYKVDDRTCLEDCVGSEGMFDEV